MEETLVKRLNQAVEFLKDNMVLKVGDFVVGVVDDQTIYVDLYSSYSDVENISQEKAFMELNTLRDNFQELLGEASKFYEYAKHKRIEYNLVLNTGTGGVLICRDSNGKMEYFI